MTWRFHVLKKFYLTNESHYVYSKANLQIHPVKYRTAGGRRETTIFNFRVSLSCLSQVKSSMVLPKKVRETNIVEGFPSLPPHSDSTDLHTLLTILNRDTHTDSEATQYSTHGAGSFHASLFILNFEEGLSQISIFEMAGSSYTYGPGNLMCTLKLN